VVGFFVVVTVAAALLDPIGWGYLLSTHVDDVAEARLAEPLGGIPFVYLLASLLPAAGTVLAFPDVPLFWRWAWGVAVALFFLGTVWDMRRRRGTIAVYIKLRREALHFYPLGDVIEIPKLMFVVMNEPTPLVWLVTAGAFATASAALFPRQLYWAAVPLAILAVAATLVWSWQRRSPWEPVARRIRRASYLSGDALVAYVRQAVELDPEVVLARLEAEEQVSAPSPRSQDSFTV